MVQVLMGERKGFCTYSATIGLITLKLINVGLEHSQWVVQNFPLQETRSVSNFPGVQSEERRGSLLASY